jgi:ribokinase
MAKARIVVVGSTNTDLTVLTERLPSPGETVLGGELMQAGGGKGANQAVAAARAGAQVAFVGRVGADDFGRAAVEGLRREGIDTAHVRADEHATSGVALIMVDRKGENLIAVASGANGRLTPDDVRAAGDAIAAADLVLLQLEIPLPAVREAVRLARRADVPVLLNPAPAPAEGALTDLLGELSYLTPNEGEACRLLGDATPVSPEEAARRLVAAGVGAVVLTLGARGACVCEGGECRRVAPPAVKAVDTVGAGDCFSGVMAVGLSEGMALAEAALLATCAAALSVQRAGAQPSMPGRAEIDGLFRQQKAK